MNLISLSVWSAAQPEYPLLLDWRNHPTTRGHSYRKEPFSLDEFQSLFDTKYNSKPGFPPQWILDQGRKVGFLYAKPWYKKNALELSLFLDPAYQNKGVGTKALILYLEQIQKKGISEVVSFVLLDNERAQRAFQKAGFENKGLFEGMQKERPGRSYKFQTVLSPPPSFFVIAEAGSNFKGKDPEDDLKRAKALIEVAYASGASAVKFQLYEAKSVYALGAGTPGYLNEDIHTLFDFYALNPSYIEKLAQYAQYLGIEWMCSAFSEPHFELIDPWVKRHKIASYEINHIRLLEKAAAAQKPLILSTGSSSMRDIAWAKHIYEKNGGKNLSLMHCNAQYPAEEDGLNLKCIQTLKSTFKTEVGFSDHSLHPTRAPTLALALGATVFEKHFTLSRQDQGPDHFFALEPHELQAMLEALTQSEKMLGVAKKNVFPQEKDLANFTHRSLHALRDIQKGETFVENENIAILRSGNQAHGLHPRYVTRLKNKKAKASISAGQGLQSHWVEWN